jgi:hypothetical protein
LKGSRPHLGGSAVRERETQRERDDTRMIFVVHVSRFEEMKIIYNFFLSF